MSESAFGVVDPRNERTEIYHFDPKKFDEYEKVVAAGGFTIGKLEGLRALKEREHI